MPSAPDNTQADLLHDLNNSLGSVLQLAHLARRGAEDGSPVAADLDLLVAETERAAAALGELGAQSAPAVLVIEDDPTMRGVVERTLSEAGLRVIAASSVGEALARLTGAPPISLVLADLGVPGLEGDQLPGVLAASEGGPPVVVMSGASAAGVPGAGLLAKPFSPEELVGAARTALAGADGSDQ
jgi:CheY-like chemotaxis protein